MKKTVTAIKKIDEIKSKREEAFYKARMKKAHTQEVGQKLKELEEHVELVPTEILVKEKITLSGEKLKPRKKTKQLAK